MPKFIDVHAHIQEREFAEDRQALFARMQEAQVGAIVVGVGAESSRQAVELAEAEQTVSLWAAVGQHPVDLPAEHFDPEFFRTLLTSLKAVAIGECGLDYYRLPEDAEEARVERERQRTLFDLHTKLALQTGKPLMIHCRPSEGSMDAHEELLAVLRQCGAVAGEELRGNIHFFTGTRDIAEQYIDLGFTLSFSGVITFTRGLFDDLLRSIPLTSIHAETDSPYASPAPHRGQRNEPTYVREIVEYIARVRNEEVSLVTNALRENTQRVFGLQ